MPIYSLQPEPASLPLRRRGTDPAPEEEEDPESAPRKAQAAQALPGGAAQPGSAPFRPQQPQAAPDHMVKYLTTPEEKQRAQDWWAGKIPHDTTSQALPGVAGPGAGQHDMFQRGVVHPQVVTMEHRQDRSSPVIDRAVPLVGRTAGTGGNLTNQAPAQGVIPLNTTSYLPMEGRAALRPEQPQSPAVGQTRAAASQPQQPLAPATQPQPVGVSQQPPAVASQPTAPAAQQPPLAKPPANAPQPQQPPLARPPAQPQQPSAPPQAPPTASAAPQSTEEDPRVAAALKQAGAEVEAEAAVRKQREGRRAHLASAGLSGTADSLDALDAEAEARRADLEKQFPQHGPEYEAGMQALGKHVQQQQSQIAGSASRVQKAAGEIYQHWGKGVAGNWITGEAPKEGDEYSPGAPLSRTHLDVLDQEAKKYGVDPKDLRHHLEMQRLSDWSRPSTSYANRQQESFVDRTIRQASGRGPAEPARVLPNGSITVNPTLGEDQATFEKAIQGTYSSPEAKEAARKMWPAYHDRWLNTAREQLETSQTLPGVENYQQWRERNQLAGNLSIKDSGGKVTGFLSPNQTAQRYIDEMKARPGWRKVADNISTSLVAGGGQVVAGVLGAEALARNSFQDLTGLDVGGQRVSEAAAAMARQNQALTQSHELTGTIDGLGDRIVSGVAQAVPGIGAAVATGGAAGGAAMSFVQGAGSTYTDLYQHHIDEGMTPEQAHRAAAGTAIASGAVSAALTKVLPGGANALNNPTTREAAKKSFGTVVKSFLKGAADEIPQEVIDGGFTHIASEMNKGKTFKQAATSYAEQFPQSALTAALLGGTVHAAADHRAGSGQPAQTSPSGYVDPAITPPGKMTFNTVDAEGREVVPPGSSGQPRSSGVPITPIAMEGQVVSGQPSPTSSPSTTKSSRPPLDVETSKKLIENVSKMPAAAQQNPTTQANVAQAKGVVVAEAQKRIDNIAQMRPEARQHPKVQKDLAEAQKVVEEHGQKPESQAGALSDAQAAEGPASSTQSSSGSLPPGSSATSHGTTPLEGHATGTEGTDGSTGTHTTDGAASDSGGPQTATGTGIPHATTTPQEIDLARKITGNLDKVQARRPLNPVEQQAYDRSRGILDRSGVPIVEHSRGRTNDAGYKNNRRATEAIVASNQKLANDAPPRSSAPSTHVRMNFHDSHSETMRQAMLLADHVHDASGMEPVKLTTTTAVGKDGKTTDGAYRHAHRPYDAEIGVSRDSAYPIMTALHEFGHHVKTHLDPKDVAVIAEAARQTPEAKLIKEINHDPKYWLNDSELFSRAYAQWVVEHASHPEAKAAKEELQNILESAQGHEQFSGPEWQRVKDHLNIAMKRRKWQ